MTILRKVFYQLSPKMRFTVRKLIYYPIDFVDQITGNSDPEVPPKHMIFTGAGDFKKQGEKFLNLFIQYGNLLPDHKILDVGSGIGRIAIPLTKYLSNTAKYEGFDAIEEGINWCKKTLSKKYPHFNFRFIPIKNDLYRSHGIDAANFIFPYPDQAFDFIPVISVFTHLNPEEMLNYLQEIYKKLKPGGICFATFFIWNQASAKHQSPKSDFYFAYDFGHFLQMDKQVTGANVAFKESYLLPKIQQIGFEVLNTHYGYWSGAKSEQSALDFQDILILRK